MRSLLIFLAIALPMVLTSPGFWILVNMEVGAQSVTLMHQDGRRQETLTGPKSPWAPWAVIPNGGKLHVRGWYGSALPDPEMGFGDVDFDGDAATTAANYVEHLRRDGWIVTTTKGRYPLSAIASRPAVSCTIFAKRDDGDLRMIVATFQTEPASGVAKIRWYSTPPAAWQLERAEACF